MAKPLIHAKNSARKFGGHYTDYMEIHEFMDSSKSVIGDGRHRALTHNTWFISVVIPRVFGETMVRESDGMLISTRDIAEQHVLEDYGMRFIPTAADFLSEMEHQDWMLNGKKGMSPSYRKLITKKEAMVD